MNMPTRDPEPTGNPFHNQNPPQFDNDLTTRSSLICGGGKLSGDEYNLGLHVMALFVVLAQSTLACSFPLIAKKFPRLRIPPSFLFGARHFGTGVLIATAFVHLLPTAFISLTDPCLPAIWNNDYPAMAGAIAMAAVFFVAIVEMVFTRGHLCGGSGSGAGEAGLEGGHGGHGHAHGKKRRGRKNKRKVMKQAKDNEDDEEGDVEGTSSSDSSSGNSYAPSEEIGGKGGVGQVGFGMAGKRRSRSHSFGQGLRRVGELQRAKSSAGAGAGSGSGNTNQDDVITEDNTSPHLTVTANATEDPPMSALDEKRLDQLISGNRPGPVIVLTPQQKHKKALLQVALLEMGILFHSVFIGMALSVTGGPAFVVLLIAIVFHQTFEGLALGSRIAVLNWKSKAVQPWAMAFAYGLTTPIGQAIGLATHTLYSPASQTGLLMVGIMNAISSGLLVFAGLVELLAEDFLSDESWRELRGMRRVWACVFVGLGAVGMSVVGAWA